MLPQIAIPGKSHNTFSHPSSPAHWFSSPPCSTWPSQSSDWPVAPSIFVWLCLRHPAVEGMGGNEREIELGRGAGERKRSHCKSPTATTQVGVCPGLLYGLVWVAGSFLSLSCCPLSSLPSRHPSPKVQSGGWRLPGESNRLTLPCPTPHHTMTLLLLPLLLASLLPFSSCNKGE